VTIFSKSERFYAVRREALAAAALNDTNDTRDTGK